MGKGRTINLEKLVGDARKKADAIRRDGDLTEQAKARRLAELVQEARPSIEETLDAIDAGYETDIEALREDARASVGETDKLDAILREIRLDRLERRFSGEIGRDGASAERYAEIVAGSDPLAAEAYEGALEASGESPGYGLDSAIKEARETRREAGMSPEQRRAAVEANSLELERESAVAMGEMAGPRGSSQRERFIKKLLEGHGLRAVHRDDLGWVSPDEAAAQDAGEVA